MTACLRIWDKTIAETSNGYNILRIARIALNLLPKLANMYHDGVVVTVGRIAPYFFIYLIFGKHHVRVFTKILQKLQKLG